MRRVVFATVFAAAALFTAPAHAAGSVTCSLDSEILTIHVAGSGHYPTASVNADNTIKVFDLNDPVTCTGSAATTSNTKKILYEQSGNTDTYATLWLYKPLGSLRVEADLGDGTDYFTVNEDGTMPPRNYMMGALPGGKSGFNLDSDADADIVLDGVDGVAACSFNFTGNDDVLDARGGAAPFTGPLPVSANLLGAGGSDVIYGGDAFDTLEGDEGDDTIVPGKDGGNMRGGQSSTVDDGFDTLSFAEMSGPVDGFTDSQISIPDGLVIPEFDDFDRFIGSPYPDTLTGSPAAEDFDMVDQKADTVDCAGGNDTVKADSYKGGPVDALSNCESAAFTDFYVPPPPSSGDSSVRDVLAPLTKLGKTKIKGHKVTFRFSSEPGAHFQCRIDKKKFKACSSPASFRLKKGKHTFAVAAVDATGNQDASPALKRLKIRH